MKNYLIAGFSCLLLACGNSGSQVDLEKEYATRFEKDHTDFLKSDRLKNFEQAYEKICAASKQVDLADSLLTLDTLNLPDSLCFISERTRMGNMEAMESVWRAEDNGEKKTFFFEDYANYSRDVNALMVSAGFHQNDYAKSFVTYETEIHAAVLAKDRERFKKEYGSIEPKNAQIYQVFCNTLIKMDAVIHARYLLLVKVVGQDEAEKGYTIGHTTSFTPGNMYGLVYVYDLQAGKLKKIIPVVASNSETIQVDPSKNEDGQMSDDLKRNFGEEVADAIKRQFIVKDELPGVMGH